MTFDQLLKPEGIAAFAVVATSLVALIKYTFPVIDARVSGAVMAFAFTAIGYVLCAFAVQVTTLDTGLLVFVSWLTCATAAVGVNSTVNHVQTTRGG